MKLHLPKILLAAVLATCVAPAWAGITATKNYYDVVIDTSTTYAEGHSITYADGVVTNAILTDVTFDLKYTLIDTATPLMYVGNADLPGSTVKTNVAFGFYTTADGGITGAWDSSAGTIGAWSTSSNTITGTVANSVLSGKDENKDDVITLTASFVKTDTTGKGTHLAVGESITPSTNDIAASNVTAATTGNIYGATGLRGSDADDTKLTINTTYISKLYLTDYDTTFSIEGHSVTKKIGTYHDATAARLQLDGGDTGSAATANTARNPIFVGGSGQLFLQTHQTGSIVLQNDIYLSNGSHDGVRGDIRFGNDGEEGYTTTLTGTIYVLEDSDMNAVGSRAINIEGEVTDKYYIDGTESEGGKTLTVKGSGYDFSGKIDLSGLNIAQGVDSSSNSVAGAVTISSNDATVGNLTVGTNATLTVANGANLTVTDTLSLQSAITVNGSLTAGTISIASLEGFEGGDSYTGSDVAGNGYLSGEFQIINGTQKEGVGVVYNGENYTTDAQGKITSVDYSTFYVKSGTEAVSKLNAASTAIEMANDTTLTVDADFATVRTATGTTSVALTVDNTTDTNPTITTLSAAGVEVTVGGTSGLSIGSATAGKIIANADINLGNSTHAVTELEIRDGATVTSNYVGVSGKGFINGAVTVQGGGTLVLTGKYATGWTSNGVTAPATDSITLTGTSAEKLATLKLGSHIVMEVTDIYLNGNTLITYTEGASGAISADYTKGALETYGKGIYVTGTNNVSNAGLHARSNLTLDIAENATFEQAGNVYCGNNTPTVTKTGAGDMTFSGITSLKTVDIQAGKVVFSGASNTATSLQVAAGASAEITKDKSLVLGIATIKGNSTTNASIARNDDNNGASTYAVDNVSYNVSNANVEVTAAEEGTIISNRLIGVALTNKGVGLLTTTNGYNNLTEIIAETGDINLTYFAERNMQGTVSNLTIGEGRTVGVYTGVAGGTEKDITVSSLTASASATLNANLILTDNASLTLNGALAMGSTLTLGESMTLNGDLLSTINALSEGGTTDLFTGVDALYLGSSTTASAYLTETDAVALNTYFTNVDAGYYLGYNADGTVYAGKLVPEPTTATLSLLALAALAARRRRR